MNVLERKRIDTGIPVNVIACILGISEGEYQTLERDPGKANAYQVYKACLLLGIDFNRI